MTTAAAHWPPAGATGLSRWVPLGALAGPALFTVAWFTLGLLSPGYSLFGTRIAPYSSLSQPVSGLGLGPTGPFMNAAFVLSGVLMICGVTAIFAGIRELSSVARWSCTGLLALSGLGCVMDGIFTLESMRLHFVGFMLATGVPIVGFPIVGLLLRRVPGWRLFGSWLLLGGPLTLALLVVFFATFDPDAAGAGLGIAGLTQRALSLEIHAWYVALGWLAFRARLSRQAPDAPGQEDPGRGRFEAP